MAKCSNCGATLSCGCKKRTAKDGKSCCALCVDKYNQALTGKSTTKQQ
jgi:hypothetical protein